MKEMKRKFDSIEILILKIMLIICTILVMVAVFFEFFRSQKIVPASIFIVLLSLSSLCMGWARLQILPKNILKQVYISGIDLFTSSLFALSAIPVMWFASTFKSSFNKFIIDSLTAIHIILIIISMLLGYRAVARLLNIVKQTHNIVE